MKIIEIETVRPAIQPNMLFVLVKNDEGVVGLGESFFGPRAVEAYIHETAAPVLLAMDDISPEFVSTSLSPYLGYQGAGAEVRGNAAIDLALWDILGKQSGMPLFKLMGGTNQRGLRVYNTCAGSDYVRTSTRQASDNWGIGDDSHEFARYEDLRSFLTRPGELARELLDEGLTGMKIWPFDKAAEASGGTAISQQELDAGLSIIERIRESVGMEMDLMIELHGLWNRPTAAKIITALEPYTPFWVEDPIRADAVDALRHLANETAVPIAMGETSVGRRGALPLLRDGAVDVLTLDLQWTGGLTEARKVAALADTFGVPIAPHDCTGPATLAACIHLSLSQPNALVQETVRAFLRTWYSELVTGVPEISNGYVTGSDRPGHGVELRDEVLLDQRNERRSSSLRESIAR
ncbi:mandelate racemase/muconate lactonizing enzyme family protein [Diaminobutyricibacter sp. McL0618]|uniref:mandelate racemase/muconate lactonizing enzyme family protein n=1 Tax=Leifsonia sp. McL0618 TaxID=3415677 RepID=UPI003CEDA802